MNRGWKGFGWNPYLTHSHTVKIELLFPLTHFLHKAYNSETLNFYHGQPQFAIKHAIITKFECIPG